MALRRWYGGHRLFCDQLHHGALVYKGLISNASVASFAIDPTLSWLYAGVSRDILEYAINIGNGSLTPLSTPSIPESGSIGLAMSIDPSGKRLLSASSRVEVYAINTVTGRLSLINSGTYMGPYVNEFTFNPTGEWVYSSNLTGTTRELPHFQRQPVN